jgi:hypothetical protein
MPSAPAGPEVAGTVPDSVSSDGALALAGGADTTAGSLAATTATAGTTAVAGTASGSATQAAPLSGSGASSRSTTTRPTSVRRPSRYGPAGPSHSADGSPRAGRRARTPEVERSFFEKHRSQIFGFGIIAVIVLISAFVFIGATQPAYACSTEIDPASAAPTPAPGASATPALGQFVDDMGRTHVAVGTSVRYTFCPPASGSHYNAAGIAPVQPKYYPQDDAIPPEQWVHNLEHGALVVLYNCTDGGCDTADQSTLQQLVTNFPASPVCKIPAGVISPVVTRFDTMKAPFAAVVWDHVLFQQKLDVNQILAFFNQYGDRSNPEDLYCNPNASPSPSASGSGAAPSPTSPPTTARPDATGTPAVEPVPSPSPSAT